jgi:hypothetical protein
VVNRCKTPGHATTCEIAHRAKPWEGTASRTYTYDKQRKQLGQAWEQGMTPLK